MYHNKISNMNNMFFSPFKLWRENSSFLWGFLLLLLKDKNELVKNFTNVKILILHASHNLTDSIVLTFR